VPTHTFETAPSDIEVLIIPGGIGARNEEAVRPVVQFLRQRFASLRWCLTVCTGSWVLARAGVLDGRRATSNKRAFRTVSFLLFVFVLCCYFFFSFFFFFFLFCFCFGLLCLLSTCSARSTGAMIAN
jgi:hypothetical protein